MENRTCPVCGKQYSEYPAISRVDNKTEICPKCGLCEALFAFGIGNEQHEAILSKAFPSK